MSNVTITVDLGKKCVECGADLLEDDVELCQKHFDMEMSRVMQESKHPDEK